MAATTSRCVTGMRRTTTAEAEAGRHSVLAMDAPALAQPPPTLLASISRKTKATGQAEAGNRAASSPSSRTRARRPLRNTWSCDASHQRHARLRCLQVLVAGEAALRSSPAHPFSSLESHFAATAAGSLLRPSSTAEMKGNSSSFRTTQTNPALSKLRLLRPQARTHMCSESVSNVISPLQQEQQQYDPPKDACRQITSAHSCHCSAHLYSRASLCRFQEQAFRE